LDHIREVEKKYLEVGDVKVLIVVPTREKAETLPVLEKLAIPSGVQIKYLNVFGRSTADAYNDAIQTALDDGADFLLTVEDDTFPPDDGFFKLLQRYREIGDPKVVLGGYYVKKQENREGVHIQIVGGKRQSLTLCNKDVGVYEVYTIAQGFTLFPMECFLQTEYPWTVTTAHLTQDSFLSQKLRDKGFKLLVDGDIKCRHLDVTSGKYYE
jgi:GT2 family glycosyltransferase